MSRTGSGFSLVELLVALSIAVCLSAMMFQLFHQNERVARDQTVIMEMQQTARIVASQIADELRMAGQGVPLFASNFDMMPSEAVAVILATSTSNRVDFRAALSNVETAPSSTTPLDLTTGVAKTVSVASAAGFAAGKFVYVWGPNTTNGWSWVRAELTGAGSKVLTLTPRNSGTMDATVRFQGAPTIALEEAISISFLNGTVRRATASSLSQNSIPAWSPANEIGRNFLALNFTYYDAAGHIASPSSLENRMSIARVDISLTVQATSALSNGKRPTYSMELKTVPRNMRVRKMGS